MRIWINGKRYYPKKRKLTKEEKARGRAMADHLCELAQQKDVKLK